MTLTTFALTTASRPLLPTPAVLGGGERRGPASEWSQETLLEALLQDDARGWREFNTRYSAMLHRCIARVVRRFRTVVDADACEEVYASLCVQLLSNDKAKLRSFDASRGTKLSSWLGMLASHAAYDHLRARRRLPRGASEAEADAIPSSTPDPFDVCAARERVAHVAELLESFTTRDRELVMLYYGEGLEPEQIATRMGISVKTVYSKKHKLQARLEALLGRQRAAA